MGELIIGILSFTFALVTFIAIMKCWENTGAMAADTRKLWWAYAQLHGLDPKTGGSVAKVDSK